MSTMHDVEHALTTARGLMDEAKRAREWERRLTLGDVFEPDAHARLSHWLHYLTADLCRLGTLIVHTSGEVESATWFRVDVDETGEGFDVVAHTTTWWGRADLLHVLLTNIVHQLASNVRTMRHRATAAA